MISIVVPLKRTGTAGIVAEPSREERARQATQRTPPKRGICRRCGQDKPINRLMLCYPCWIKERLEAKGWREGQPHPPDCGCALDCRFDSLGADN